MMIQNFSSWKHTKPSSSYLSPYNRTVGRAYNAKSSTEHVIPGHGNIQAKRFRPQNEKQLHYANMLKDDKPYIVIAYGSAGTGKTFCAASVGIDLMEQGLYNRMVLTRPAVCVEEEEHGFLPGGIDSKMKPWILPIYDVLHSRLDPIRVERMIKNNTIEIAPLAYMRGRTFENAWIILDEAQNCTVGQMKMVLTRIGKGSKLIITGDPTQHDRTKNENGLIDFINRIHSYDMKGLGGTKDSSQIGLVEFHPEDVERHEVIPYIIDLYNLI